MNFFIRIPYPNIAWGVVPKWYGLVYNEDYDRVRVFCPMPFNVILNWSINLYWLIAYKLSKNLRNRFYDKGYSEGVQKGFCNGYIKCLEDLKGKEAGTISELKVTP